MENPKQNLDKIPDDEVVDALEEDIVDKVTHPESDSTLRPGIETEEREARERRGKKKPNLSQLDGDEEEE